MTDETTHNGLRYRARDESGTPAGDGEVPEEPTLLHPEDAANPPGDPANQAGDATNLTGGGGSGARRKMTEYLRRARIALLLLTLAACGVLWWFSGAITPPEPDALTLAPLARFEQQIEAILQGESNRLHTTDFVVGNAMLQTLPIETLAASDTARLENVLIDAGMVDDEGLAILSQLPHLEHLRLRLSPVTDAGLESLLQTPSLWVLNLPHSRVTADGVASLAALPRLRQLRLGSPELTNDACGAIAQIQSLRSLHLIGVPVTDEGLKQLAELPHLESLYLDDSAVTERGWTWLFRNHPHLHVHVNQRHHDRDPKAHPH